MSPKTLRAEWEAGWQPIWVRDYPYHDPQSCWFHRETGEVLWEEPDAPEGVLPDEVKSAPASWEEIRPLRHGDHHEIFARFPEGMPPDVQDLCNTKSMGGFFDTYAEHFGSDEEVRHDWHAFHDDALKERAREWLRGRGWEVMWS